MVADLEVLVVDHSVEAAQEAVRAGETIPLDLEAPFAGAVLLTVEGPSVLAARVVELDAGTHRVSMPMPRHEGAGAYATATLVRGAGARGDGAARLLGACWVAVDRPERALALFTSPPAAPGALPRSVDVGAPADLCLLDRPWSQARADLSSAGVAATIRDGSIIWQPGLEGTPGEDDLGARRPRDGSRLHPLS